MTSKLKEARLNAGYSIEDISLKLNIRKQYLIDLEEEDFEAIPGQIYVEGYTKLYAEFLGIERPVIGKNSNTKPIKKAKSKLKVKIKKKLSQKYFVLSSILLLIVIFVNYNYIKHKGNASSYNSGAYFSDHSNENNIDENTAAVVSRMISGNNNTIKSLDNILEDENESYDTEFTKDN